jgi:hypothetical protein
MDFRYIVVLERDNVQGRFQKVCLYLFLPESGGRDIQRSFPMRTSGSYSSDDVWRRHGSVSLVM